MRSLQWMLRHNAGYYVKHVQNGMDAMLNLHGLRVDKSKGCSINMRRHGIKTGLLDLILRCVSMCLYLKSWSGRVMLASPKKPPTDAARWLLARILAGWGRTTANSGRLTDRTSFQDLRKKETRAAPTER